MKNKSNFEINIKITTHYSHKNIHDHFNSNLLILANIFLANIALINTY